MTFIFSSETRIRSQDFGITRGLLTAINTEQPRCGTYVVADCIYVGHHICVPAFDVNGRGIAGKWRSVCYLRQQCCARVTKPLLF